MVSYHKYIYCLYTLNKLIYENYFISLAVKKYGKASFTYFKVLLFASAIRYKILIKFL